MILDDRHRAKGKIERQGRPRDMMKAEASLILTVVLGRAGDV